MRLTENIGNIIDSGLEEYKKVENKLQKHMKDKGSEYSPHNERPIATFMTEWIKNHFNNNGDNFIVQSFNELPLKGIKEDDIAKIKKRFFAQTNIKKDIKKKYSWYSIDGYLSLYESNKKIEDLFIEYKVNNKFRIHDMAIDLLKFLIYTYNSNNKENFLYIVFYKDENSFKNINKKIKGIDLSNFEKSPYQEYNLFGYMGQNKLSEEEVKVAKAALIGFDIIKEQTNDAQLSISDHKYNKFENNTKLKAIGHFGKNVFFSNKMKLNVPLLKDIYKKIKEKHNEKTEHLPEIDNDRIYKIISGLKAMDKDKSNAKRTTIKKATNWWLALFCAASKKWLDDDRLSEFEYGDVNGNGHVRKSDENTFKEMINEVKNKFIDREKNPTNLSDIYSLLKIINDVYDMTYSYDESGKLPTIKPEYNDFKNIYDIQKKLKRIYEEITKDSYGKSIIKNTSKFTDELSQAIINKFTNS